jgi:solute carrier family 25 (mitochondrial carnitine/acylcarnitine transporter), member 20/29
LLRLCTQGLATTQELGAAQMMFAGGLGGIAFWLFVYPIDVIKSRLQVQRRGHEQYGGILDCYNQIRAKEGLHGLYKGFAPCLARAFPANAVAFLAYENAMTLLQSQR